MSTLSDLESGAGPASAERSIPAGSATMRPRGHTRSLSACADAEPSARPDYRAQIRDVLARVAAVRRALRDDQREIDRLRRDTRCILDGLLAA